MLRFAAVAALGATLALTAAPALAAQAPVLMTAQGIGPIKIGATLASLKAAHLIGKVQLGCELNQPRGYGAPLKNTFKGFVGFDQHKRVTSISAESRAVDVHGLTIGSTDEQVLKAYPKAHYDKAKTTDPIPYSVIAVGPVGTPRYSFLVDPKTRKVVELDIPYAQVCE